MMLCLADRGDRIDGKIDRPDGICRATAFLHPPRAGLVRGRDCMACAPVVSCARVCSDGVPWVLQCANTSPLRLSLSSHFTPPSLSTQHTERSQVWRVNRSVELFGAASRRMCNCSALCSFHHHGEQSFPPKRRHLRRKHSNGNAESADSRRVREPGTRAMFETRPQETCTCLFYASVLLARVLGALS